MLNVDRNALAEAAERGIVSPAQAERLWTFLQERGEAARGTLPVRPPPARFTFTSALYYLGGLLAVGAMTLFLKLGWDRFGGWGVAAISIGYLAASLSLASRFEARGLVLPMTLLATLAVTLVSLAVWGIERALGAPADGRPLAQEAAALLAAVLVLRRYRAPFLVVPVAVALWYLGMDLTVGLLAPEAKQAMPEGSHLREWYSVVAGLSLLVAAFRLDLRRRAAHDHAFWLHLCGLLAAWGGITVMDARTLAGTLAYLALNGGLVLLGAAFFRRAFTVFGVMGVAIGLGSLGERYLKDSWLLPIAITLIGLGVVGFGLWWSRNEARLSARLQELLPARLRESIAERRPTPWT
jgi:hypothetical protein